jgi:hypothetical protein
VRDRLSRLRDLLDWDKGALCYYYCCMKLLKKNAKVGFWVWGVEHECTFQVPVMRGRQISEGIGY